VSLAPTVARAQELRIKHAKARPASAPTAPWGVPRSCTPLKGRSSTSKAIRGALTARALSAQGAAIYQLHINPNRATKLSTGRPRYRVGVWDLDRAMDRVAELVKKTAMRPSSNGSRTASS